MRKAATILRVAALVLWVVALLALLLTVLGVRYVPEGYTYVPPHALPGNQWMIPTWGVSLGLVAVALVLCLCLRHKEAINWLPLLLAVAGAILGLIVALEFKGALPSKAGIQYATQGITPWRLIWRHLTPVFAGALTAIAARLNHIDARDERILAENEAYKEHYDLSEDSTIGLDTYGEDFGIQKPARKLKKSLRRKKNK